MTVAANLEDELVLHRDFERVDASEPPRTKREGGSRKRASSTESSGRSCGTRSRRRRSSPARSGRWPTAGSTATSDTRRDPLDEGPHGAAVAAGGAGAAGAQPCRNLVE